MRAFVGTSGYSYAPWKGSFYPSDLPAAKMLGYYAERFRSVEINNTFYKLPAEKAVAQWAAQVPEGFVFAVKASQYVTHRQRLKDASADKVLEAMAPLGAKLGPILVQLPPNLKKDVPLLEAFLATLPATCRAAFEFRHASWFDDAVYAALRARGQALCVAESEDLATPLVATAPWGYLRLRREDYTSADVAAWGEKIAAQGWGDAFVFFKHEDAGIGPRLAAELVRCLGGAASPA